MAVNTLTHRRPVDVAGTAGQTILEVARETGIHIPTLCHLDGLSDVGACRLCLVEVAGSATSRCRPASPRWPRAWT